MDKSWVWESQWSKGTCKKCWYYMWRQVFPVNSESKIDGRKEMNEWTITLAFPFNERLTMRALCAGIFAFLPKEMITGFPFIIQADFMLSFSRETILMDNKWNLGILGCVPSMFVAAFVSYSSKQPLRSLPRMFEFLPLIVSSYTLLNDIRTTISTSLNERSFLPFEPFSDKKMTFCKPVEAIRVLPEFREVLMRAQISNLAVVDETFYGEDIHIHLPVLEFLGVVAVIDNVYKKISLLNSIKPTCEDVISLLNFIKNCTVKMPAMLCTLKNSLGSINFLKTRHGFKCPSGSILFEPKWGMINQFVDLPIIDDGYYGIRIYQYRGEFEQMGVTIDFSKGSHFIRNGLQFPKEPGNFPSETSLLIFQSLRSMLNNSTTDLLLQPFLDYVSKSKWLKTSFGYKTPKECMLLDSTWSSNLEYTDGPFLDQEFYGNIILSYKKELKAIGVKADIEEVAKLLFQTMGWHVNFLVIVRIYSFLNMYNWRPCTHDQFNYQVWIPNGEDTGNWVNSQYCVLSDTGNLFETNPNQIYTLDRYRSNSLPQIIYSTFEVGNMVKSQVFSSESSDPHQIYALDNYYEKPLLKLFSSVFRVRETPSVNDYVTLWKRWVEEQHEVSHDECCIVWDSIDVEQ